MSNIEEYTEKMFDSIKHIDENGNEYWSARELMPILEYSKWENFHKIIKQSMIACKESKYNIDDHFAVQRKMIKLAKGATRSVIDYKLSRYACYLIVMNGNPNKKIIALGQTHFIIQTRRQELTKKGNHSLNLAAKNAGVKNFDKFTNAGYKGLYNGETANDIAKRKGLRYREDILDNMGEDELVANLFRINQTKQKLINDKVKGESNANETHYMVGKAVRDTIKKLGGSMPEDLPTPEKSLKELGKEKNKLIK